MTKVSNLDKITQSYIVERPINLMAFLEDKKIRNSKNAIKSVLRRKIVLVNNKLVTQYDYSLKNGDKVFIMKTDQTQKVKRLKGLSIVYEDNDLIIIDKNSGLLSVGTPKSPDNNAYHIVQSYINNKPKKETLFVVQRVERELSGLMFFVKSIYAQARFKKNWDYMVPKINYLGIISGKLPNTSGQIQSWLTENANLHIFSAPINNGGLEAITNYEILRTNEHLSLVNFEMKTRHRNQIRAQMQQLGTPIVGDKKFGAKFNPLKRTLLHISMLSLRHPITGKILTFKSDLSKEALKLVRE